MFKGHMDSVGWAGWQGAENLIIRTCVVKF